MHEPNEPNKAKCWGCSSTSPMMLKIINIWKVCPHHYPENYSRTLALHKKSIFDMAIPEDAVKRGFITFPIRT
jgi:hypothetical protein